jgi:molybdopterin-guanine dinucleotide biosynthesis protein A
LLLRVLDATAEADRTIVVGPPSLAPLLPAGVALVQEEPAGGGPVAGLAAGLRLAPAAARLVAVLSADLPFLTPAVLRGLCQSLDHGGEDVAVLVDESDRPQWLCAVWRRRALVQRLGALDDPWGARMRDLTVDAGVRHVSPEGSGPPPWFDCDTEEDFRRAEELLS